MFGPHRLPCETLPPPSPGKASGKPSRFVLPATILGSSLSFIDSSVVNVALPAIGRDLNADLATLQWIVNGYMLTFASLILLGGAAGDRLGRRRLFLIGLVAFAASSAGAALAPSPGWLIALRMAQGAAAALVAPASLAIIGEAFKGEERGPAVGVWAASGAVTTALGPVLGGWIADAAGWRSIFFINLPVAVAAFWLGLRLPKESLENARGGLDIAGAALAIAALGLLSLGLIALGDGRPILGGGAIAAAIPAALAFLRVESRSPAPLMPLSLFADRKFAGANGLTLLLYAAMTGGLFLLPFVLIEAHGYSAAAAGAAFLPFSAIMGAGSHWAGKLTERIGARLPLVVGPLITAGGFALLAVSGGDPVFWTGFLPGLVIIGIGMTLAVTPLMTAVFDSAPADKSGTASGVNNAVARAAGLIAVAALGLAFGGSAAIALEKNELLRAYRLVMLVAAGLAAASALIAAATISASPAAAGSRA
jgi:EmrB/QacA subfamily drug resistance transporter